MKAQQVVNALTEVQSTSSVIIGIFNEVDKDPAHQIDAEIAGNVIFLVTQLLTKAIEAYAAAGGTEINPDSILALLPNPAPLTPPTA